MNLRIEVIALFICAVAMVPREGLSQCCTTLHVDRKSYEVQWQKVGFAEFGTNPSTPPKIYRTRTTTDIVDTYTNTTTLSTDTDYSFETNGGHILPRSGVLYMLAEGTGEARYLGPDHVATATFRTNGTFHVVQSVFGHPSNTATFKVEGTHTVTNGDKGYMTFNPSSYGESYDINIDQAIFRYTPFENEVGFSETYPDTACPGDEPNQTGTMDLDGWLGPEEGTTTTYREYPMTNHFPGKREQELSAEYTRTVLTNTAFSKLSECSITDWNVGSRYDCTNGCVSTSVEKQAYFKLEDNEINLTLRRVEFRFRFETKTNLSYQVFWEEHTDVDGAVTIKKKKTDLIAGTGKEVMSTTGVLLPPPADENGSVKIVGAEVEVTGPDCECTSGCSAGDNTPGEPDLTLGSLSASFGLGLTEGGSAGSLLITAEEPSPELATPAELQATVDTNVVSITYDVATGYIDLIEAPQVVVDVVVITNWIYQMQFFVPAVYQTNGDPYLVHSIENPSGDTNDHDTLRIVETRDGKSITNQFTWLGGGPTNSWELERANGLRGERLTKVYDSAAKRWTETEEIYDPGTSAVITKVVRLSDVFDWGLGLVSETVDPQGVNLITTNTYTSQGLLESSIRGDGSWVLNEYDTEDKLARSMSSFENQALTTDTNLCRTTTYDYTPVSGSGDDGSLEAETPRTTVEYLLGKVIGRSWTIIKEGERIDVQAQSLNADWDDADSLRTTTRSYTNGNYVTQPRSVTLPDGTQQAWLYGTNAAGSTVTTVLTGEADIGSDTNVLSGTRVVTETGPLGQTLSVTNYDIASGKIISGMSYERDEFLRTVATHYFDGTTEEASYDCCNVSHLTARDGSVTTYLYDDLKRQSATIANGITTSNIYDAAGRVLISRRIGSGGDTIDISRVGYDGAGRLIGETNALDDITTHGYAFDGSGQLITTTTYFTNSSSGIQRVETYAKDGSLVKVTGSATYPVRYDYGLASDGTAERSITRIIKLDASYNDTSEVMTNFTDLVGRNYRTTYGDGAVAESVYNSIGQLIKQVDPDGVRTLYSYNDEGRLEVSAIDADRSNDTIDLAEDRATKTVSDVTDVGGVDVLRTRTYSYYQNGSSSPTQISEGRQSSDGLASWSLSFGLESRADVAYAGSGNRYITNTAPDQSFTISHYLSGRLQSVTRKDNGGNQIGKVTYGYDDHGRRITEVDARSGTTTYGFDDLDRVTSVTTPVPGTGAGAQTTSFTYDRLGREIQTTQPDGGVITKTYFDTGELKSIEGARTYPVEYGYDAQGRMTNMTTWQDYLVGGDAKTTWGYDARRGFMTAKVYEGGGTIDYTYTPGGRLRTRAWDRGITTTYLTNAFGDVTGIDYSDSSADVTYTLDRLGRRTSIVDGAGTHQFTYHDSGLPLRETNSAGTLAGLSVTNGYDSLLRRTSVSVLSGSTPMFSQTFAYDESSRLEEVSDGAVSATYSYLANSSLIGSISYKDGATTRMTATRTYDQLGRLSQIVSVPSADVAVGNGYQYDAANQRIRTTQQDGSYWIYQYDSLGQVTSGKKFWLDGTPVAGQQFEYAFDDIGNRTSSKAGGDQSGQNLRQTTYSANDLNQYTGRIVPGYADLLGSANVNATVSVNGDSGSTYRFGEYYRYELSIDNDPDAAYLSATVIAEKDSVSQTNAGNIYLPARTNSFSYDADGNLTGDGLWGYTWNGENRLVTMETIAGAPFTNKLEFIYDHQGRRVSKVVSSWTGTAWVVDYTRKFIYDGWNLLAEVDGGGSLVNSYMWGTDLSGSPQGAGGVGGLLALDSASEGTHFVAYDGNGNVVALIDADDGTISGRYEYDPFGGTLRVSGDVADLNPFRFSSKYVDDETQMSYYGYRYYNPSTGRWLNRDLVEEVGGPNLYAFVGNASIGAVDVFGLCKWQTTVKLWTKTKVGIELTNSKVPFETDEKLTGVGISGDIFKVTVEHHGGIECRRCCYKGFDNIAGTVVLKGTFHAGVGYGVKLKIPYLGLIQAGIAGVKLALKAKELAEKYEAELGEGADAVILVLTEPKILDVTAKMAQGFSDSVQQEACDAILKANKKNPTVVIGMGDFTSEKIKEIMKK